MELVVTRRWLDDVSSIGELTIDGALECYTLEDRTRAPDDVKIFGETAIPLGRYRVTIERSPRLSMLAGRDVFMPRLHGVPLYEGVLIHPGNVPKDTLGCILLGMERGQDEIRKSRVAFDSFFLKLNAALARGEEAWLTVRLGEPIGVAA